MVYAINNLSVAAPFPEFDRVIPFCNSFCYDALFYLSKGAHNLETSASAGPSACSQVGLLSMAIYNTNRLLFSNLSALLECRS